MASPELRWIYDTAPIGLAFLSPDCRYLQINQRLTDICGISVEDHLGRTVREMVPKLADQVEALVKAVVAGGKPVTGIEVNQSIQDQGNGVMLIRGKRAVARVHVKSDGPSVAGVTALLYRLSADGSTVLGEPLIPSNNSGQYITVPASPNRTQLEQSFWFELPIEWTEGVSLGGLNQNFESLNEALAAVRRATDWKVAELREVEEGASHYIAFSYKLDTALLPRPIQIGISGQPEWNLRLENTVRFE